VTITIANPTPLSGQSAKELAARARLLLVIDEVLRVAPPKTVNNVLSVLSMRAVGSAGGSVKIRGCFQEERTYPRARDPKSSKG
jgi:hypothetical protein